MRAKLPRTLPLLLALATLHGCAATPNTPTAGRPLIAAGATYRSSLEPHFTIDASLAPLAAQLTAAAQAANRTLAVDEDLSAVARDVAQRILGDAQRRNPSVRVIQALCWSHGVIDPVPTVVVTRVQGPPPADAYRSAIAAPLAESEANVAGLAAATAGNERVLVTLLAQRRVGLDAPIALQPLAGERVRLRGRVAQGLNSPEVVLTLTDGRTERFPLGDGPDFLGQFPVPDRGTWQVELSAVGPRGGTVLANFPLYVDTPPPRTPDEMAQTTTQDATAAEAELLTLINESRRAAGRAPLQNTAELSAVARGHSEDMARNHYLAHNAPNGRRPVDRLRGANLTTSTLLENLGRGYSAREIHDGLMASPGHRANLLNERVTHVGIGVAADQGTGRGLVATEDFIEVAGAIDLNAAPGTILSRINRTRAQRNLPVLATRPQLVELAQSTARRFFEGRATQREVLDAVNSQTSRLGLLFRRVVALATLVPRLDDATGLEPLLDAEVSAVGVGVAQGTRSDTQPNAIFVVYVLAYSR